MTSIQKLIIEIDFHLLNDEKPSIYLNEIVKSPLFEEYPLELLRKLNYTKQSPKYHAEGNAWNHTMLVVDEAATVKNQSQNEKAFMWAALLHDIGKPDTTKDHKGRITSYNHEKIGAELAREFLTEFTDDEVLIDRVVELVRWHMQILFVINDLPFADVKAMKKKTDISEIALLGLCDRLGRFGANVKEEESNIKLFIQKCKLDKSDLNQNKENTQIKDP